MNIAGGSFLLRALLLAAVLLAGMLTVSADPITVTGLVSVDISKNPNCQNCSVQNGATIDTVKAFDGGAGSSQITFRANASMPPQFNVSLTPGQALNLTVVTIDTSSSVPFGNTGPYFDVNFKITPTLQINGETLTLVNAQSFEGRITGRFSQDHTSIEIQFAGPQVLTFFSPTLGTFSLTLPELSRTGNPCTTTHLTGTLTYLNPPPPPPSEVPEPATLVLLGTGLAGIAGFGKKRKK